MNSKYIEITPRDPDCVHVVQLTDPHISAAGKQQLKGMDTTMSLEQIIAMVNADPDQPDMILATGDLVHVPEPAAYERLLHVLRQASAPVFCLPGNHDLPGMMEKQLNTSGISTRKLLRCGNWQFILLNSVLENREQGYLSDDELRFLELALRQADGQVAVGLHHHPVSISSPWMDAMKVKNGDEFMQLVRNCPRVRCVFWGHIHQEYTSSQDHILLLGTPSTCIQFKAGTLQFVKDVLPPGYRKIKFHGDGSIDTTLHWLDMAMEHESVKW